MHDDDTPVTPEPELPESYWMEAQWEQSMLENEKLMDRYEQVCKENPDRRWDDPLDLYHKVHYDLDFGEENGPQPPVAQEPTEAGQVFEPEEPIEDAELDDFRQIPAYKIAYEFSLSILDYMKQCGKEKSDQDLLRDELCRHALRIAADIAGGHGLGYDEETLCGNIVKNRWALSHARETQRLLQVLIEHDGPDVGLTALLAQTNPIIQALEERIVQLRAKVWWDN